ncbi:MAG: energy transducer TonB, partial [Rhizobiaceae bacterium]
PALAVLSAPPTLAEAPETAPEPVSTARDTAEAPLPDAVAATPTPRPQAQPPVAKDKPASPAQAEKPASRQTAEAPKAKATATNAAKKAERTAEPKPAPAAKKPAAQPAAKRPAKSEAGSGAAASAGTSAGVEAAYGRKLLSHVERRKRYPAAAKAAGISGAVKLSVTIDRAGQLKSARVSKSSGHSVLDEEALATARRAAPYPAPPDGVGGRTFAFSVTLRFSR